MSELNKLIQECQVSESEFGGLDLELYGHMITLLAKYSNYDSLSRTQISAIVKLSSSYLDRVLQDRRVYLTLGEFEFQRAILYFIKGFKEKHISRAPPTFFTMVNTVAVCLMVVSREDLIKIRKFINFWVEKIEVELADEDDYDFPKYLMRSTLCHLLCQLKEYQECIRISNFNVKEIASDVDSKFYYRSKEAKDQFARTRRF